MKYILIIISVFFLSACSSVKKTGGSKSTQLLNELIQSHGGKHYETAQLEFKFRGNTYQVYNHGSKFSYFKKFQKNGDQYIDVLNNAGFYREVNGEVLTLNEKEISRFSNALNSVVYFATLPYKLKDPAVNHIYAGSTEIKGKSYEMLRISFQEMGGGDDHEDQYLFWINKETKRMDYFAYNYKVNKGGVRFREAFNPRIVDGIVIQDYINYKAPVGTSLDKLPSLFEKGELEKLSEILTEDIKSLID